MYEVFRALAERLGMHQGRKKNEMRNDVELSAVVH